MRKTMFRIPLSGYIVINPNGPQLSSSLSANNLGNKGKPGKANAKLEKFYKNCGPKRSGYQSAKVRKNAATMSRMGTSFSLGMIHPVVSTTKHRLSRTLDNQTLEMGLRNPDLLRKLRSHQHAHKLLLQRKF
jgi:hypothetical protein